MKKNLLTLLLCAAMTMASLAGCGGQSAPAASGPEQPPSSGVSSSGKPADAPAPAADTPASLIIPVASCVSNLNCQLESYKEGWIMLNPIYDQLYYMDVDETRYYLAESYTMSEDNTTLTLKLKDGLTWHDGEPITADDVIFTLDVNKDTNNGAGNTNVVYLNEQPIAYEKVDGLTVKITLPAPSASYSNLLGKLKLLPMHAFGGNTNIVGAEANLQGIGSGPYKVVDFQQDQYLQLEKFDGYYGGTPAIDQVIFKIISDASAQEVSLLNGEINFMELSTAEASAKYASDASFKVVAYPEGRVNYLAVNKFCETFNDPKVKEAVFAALNRDEIILGAYGEGMAEPANSIFSNVTLYYDGSVPSYTYDLDKAKTLVEEAGLSGKTMKLYFNSERANMKETAQIIQQQLKAAGITLEVTPLESSGFFEKVFGTDGDYEFYLNGYAALGDPDEVVAGMYDGTWGVNIAVSDEAAQLWKDGRATSDTAKRKEVYKKLQEQANTDMSVYPIAYPNYTFVTTANLKGTDTYKTTPIFEDYTKLSFE